MYTPFVTELTQALTPIAKCKPESQVLTKHLASFVNIIKKHQKVWSFSSENVTDNKSFFEAVNGFMSKMNACIGGELKDFDECDYFFEQLYEIAYYLYAFCAEIKLKNQLYKEAIDYYCKQYNLCDKIHYEDNIDLLQRQAIVQYNIGYSYQAAGLPNRDVEFLQESNRALEKSQKLYRDITNKTLNARDRKRKELHISSKTSSAKIFEKIKENKTILNSEAKKNNNQINNNSNTLKNIPKKRKKEDVKPNIYGGDTASDSDSDTNDSHVKKTRKFSFTDNYSNNNSNVFFQQEESTTFTADDINNRGLEMLRQTTIGLKQIENNLHFYSSQLTNVMNLISNVNSPEISIQKKSIINDADATLEALVQKINKTRAALIKQQDNENIQKISFIKKK